uniref:Ground-like domain-containing protein n=1 Tax=Strongyloides papillosus TaxID=174720 RepID=A0A0N5B4C6_STREA
MYKIIIILLLVHCIIDNINGCIPIGMPNCDCQQSPDCGGCLSKTYYYNYDQPSSYHQQYAYPTLIETSNQLPSPPPYPFTNNINQEPVIESNFPGMDSYLTTIPYSIPKQNTPEYFEADRILASSIKKINNEDAYRHSQEVSLLEKNAIEKDDDVTSSFKIETTSLPQDSAMNYPTADVSTNVNTGFEITVKKEVNTTSESYNNYYQKTNIVNAGNTLPDPSTISPIPYDPKDVIYKIKHESKVKDTEIPLQSMYYGYKSYPILRSSDIQRESNFTFKNYLNTICNGDVISKGQESSLKIALDRCNNLKCSGMNIKNITSGSPLKTIPFLEVVYLSKINDKMSLQGYSCFTSKF